MADVTTLTNPAWKDLDCARCHELIAREWASTRHAQAWNEELYQEELETIRKKSKCTSCHAPEPLLVAGITKRPKTRATDVHLGVGCDACHLGPSGAMHGPWGAETAAHASVRDELFSELGSNELCLSCHSRSVGPVIGIGLDFDDEDLGERGYSCVGCHMAPVERPVATDPESGAVLAVRAGRSHLLQHPRDPSFLRQAFRIEARRAEGGAVFSLANRAGHRIPGLNDREILFRIELLDANGEVLVLDSLEVTREEPIELGETLELPLSAVGADVLRVRATHEAKSLERAVQFLDERIPLGG